VIQCRPAAGNNGSRAAGRISNEQNGMSLMRTATEETGERGLAQPASSTYPSPRDYDFFGCRFVRDFRLEKCQESHAKCLSHIIFSPVSRCQFLDFFGVLCMSSFRGIPKENSVRDLPIGFLLFPRSDSMENIMSKPGITPEARMYRRPQKRKISMRSAAHHVAGPEQDYPTYRFSGRVFVEKPKHNPFKGL
jgi:hypothetical protein